MTHTHHSNRKPVDGAGNDPQLLTEAVLFPWRKSQDPRHNTLSSPELISAKPFPYSRVAPVGRLGGRQWRAECHARITHVRQVLNMNKRALVFLHMTRWTRVLFSTLNPWTRVLQKGFQLQYSRGLQFMHYPNLSSRSGLPAYASPIARKMRCNISFGAGIHSTSGSPGVCTLATTP